MIKTTESVRRTKTGWRHSNPDDRRYFGNRSTATAVLWGILCVIAFNGCGDTSQAPQEPSQPQRVDAAQQRPLKLVVVDDDQLAAVAHREWTARASRRLDVEAITELQFTAWKNSDFRQLDDADAIIISSDWVGELAEYDLIEFMPDYVQTNLGFADGDMAIETDILPLCRTTMMRWGEQYCGLPVAARPFVLGYRGDVIKELGLPAPDSIESMREVIKSFAAADRRDGWPQWALDQPLAPGWSVKTFLARAAPYCRHRGRFSALFELRTMQPTIDGAEYVRALEELAQDLQLAGGQQRWLAMDPTACFQSLLEGDSVMAIGWPGDISNAQLNEGVISNLEIVEFPGSTHVYSRSEEVWQQRLDDEAGEVPFAFPSDRMAVVLKSSRSQRAAWNLIARLTGKEWGSIVAGTSEAAGPVRRSQLRAAYWSTGLPRPLIEPYREALESTFGRRTCLTNLRLPAVADYLSELDAAVRECCENQSEAAEALKNVSEKWQQITRRQGVEAQVRAYHRSLGLQP